MKKIIGGIFAIFLLMVSMSITGVLANDQDRGPAPNSGDGIPDGSGWAGDWVNEDNPGETKGPAPNSGDGIPDGSGF